MLEFMKILFLGTSTITANGTTQRMLFLAKALNDRGFSLSVSLEDSTDNRSFCEKYLARLSCHFYSSGPIWKELLQKHRLINSGQYDIVHNFCLGLRFLTFRGFLTNRNVRVIYDWDELLSTHARSSFFTCRPRRARSTRTTRPAPRPNLSRPSLCGRTT